MLEHEAVPHTLSVRIPAELLGDLDRAGGGVDGDGLGAFVQGQVTLNGDIADFAGRLAGNIIDIDEKLVIPHSELGIQPHPRS